MVVVEEDDSVDAFFVSGKDGLIVVKGLTFELGWRDEIVVVEK